MGIFIFLNTLIENIQKCFGISYVIFQIRFSYIYKTVGVADTAIIGKILVPDRRKVENFSLIST